MSTTKDPNPPVTSGEEEGPWSGETAHTAGSQDTELVVGSEDAPTSKEADKVDSSYFDGATVNTEGIYQSPGYNLGAFEDDETNPETIAPNTNPGLSGPPYVKYDGTTNGASAANTVVPGDTEFAFGHASNAAADDIVHVNPPGAKQPDLGDGSDQYVGHTDPTDDGRLDTELAFGFLPSAGGLSGNEKPLGTGGYAGFYGQTVDDDSQVLDTTNTSNPTTIETGNDGTGASQIPTSYDLTAGHHHGIETSSIDGAYPNLGMGGTGTAPDAPRSLTWQYDYSPGAALVTWQAPVEDGGNKIREYVVQGYQVRTAAKIPAASGSLAAWVGQPSVTKHSHTIPAYDDLDDPVIATVAQTATSAGTLHKNTAYSYKVEALNATGHSAPSAAVAVTTPNVLAAPVVSGATQTSADGGSFGTNTTYYYKVTATNAVGETTGSNEVSAVVAAGTDSVTVAWAAVTGATGYKVYRGTVAGSEDKLISTIGSGATVSFKDLGGAGTSNTVPVSNTTATDTNKVTVTWGAIANATSYKVYGRTSGSWLLIATVSAPTVLYVDDGSVTPSGALPAGDTSGASVSVLVERLTPGEHYFFAVYARNDVGNSPLSVAGSRTGSAVTPLYDMADPLDEVVYVSHLQTQNRL